MIELTKVCTAAFMKATNSLVFQCRVTNVKQNIVKMQFLKLLLTDFGQHRKVVHGSTKLFKTDLLQNGIHE